MCFGKGIGSSLPFGIMADYDDDEDDFDFGGSFEQPAPTRGVKRPYEDDEDEDDDEELFAVKKEYTESLPNDDHATTTILNLRASLEEKDRSISSLEAKLAAAKEELGRWQDAFRADSIIPGATSGKETPDATVALQAVLKLQTSESKLRDQLLGAKRKENAMLWKLSQKDEEIAELKSQLQDTRELTKPAMLEARRVMLDPVVHAEFTRLKTEVEVADKKVKDLQDELAAVNFTPNSMHGKMLIAKCKALQDENEEYGRDEKEGKMHNLENKLSLQKLLLTELRRGHQELQEYTDDLNDECDKLQQAVFLMQQKLEAKDKELQESKQQQQHTRGHRGGQRGAGGKNDKDRDGNARDAGAKRDADFQERRRGRERERD